MPARLESLRRNHPDRVIVRSHRDDSLFTLRLKETSQPEPQMDTLTSIRVFRQVVESGSFVGAAERLDLSNAMVSRHVSYVEKRLGVRLLNRNSRNLSLTEPGRLYFERCKGILQDLEQTELELGSFSSAPRGTLRIACCEGCFPGGWLGGVLAEYRRRWPDVMLDIAFDEDAMDIVQKGYDLAFRLASEDPLPPGVVACRVRAVGFTLAAAPKYIERNGMPRTIDELTRHDFVALGCQGSLRLASTQGAVEVPLRVVMHCRALLAVASAVTAGIGLASLPSTLFNELAQSQAVVPVLPDVRLQDSMLYVVYASRKYMPPKVRALLDLVAQSRPRRPSVPTAPCERVSA